jgi:hypothetical protein
MQQAEMLLGAMADAGRRADQAMREDRVTYDHRVGWARRNMLEIWLTYTAFSRIRPRPAEVAAMRRQLRRAIGVYRRLNLSETRGIDTAARAA